MKFKSYLYLRKLSYWIIEKDIIETPEMKERMNPDNDGLDLSDEYFKKKYDKYENESDEYFPQGTEIPPHY